MSSPSDIMMGLKSAKAARATVESTWQDVAFYTNPLKRDVINKTVDGEKIPYDVYDSTATQGNLTFGAGLSGFLTNQAQEWLELNPRNMELKDNHEEKIWFDKCTKILLKSFADSNFYNQIHELYLSLGTFGTGVFYSEEDPQTDVRYYSRDPKECYIVENKRGEVDTIYRLFEFTAYQAIQEFGRENVSEEIIKTIDEKKDFSCKFSFVHYVAPRSKRDVKKKDSKNMPFMSVWLEEKHPEKVLKEGGYEEFPFAVPRFYKNSGEPYGYGPAHIAYSDTRQINDMSKTYNQSAEVALFPPQLVEHDSMIGSLDLRAKAINYQKQPLNRGKAVEPMSNGANFQIGLDWVERIEEKINDAFFVNLFVTTRQTKRMTATEVVETSQERMFLLGPALGRIQGELLTKIVSRHFNILLRRGKFPPPPASIAELGAIDYDVVYTSPLARAQRAMQTRDINSFLAIMGQVSAVLPESLDNLDADALTRDLHSMFSIKQNILKSEERRDEERQARAEQQQQLQQQQMMMNAAAMAKDAGSATKDFAGANNGSS